MIGSRDGIFSYSPEAFNELIAKLNLSQTDERAAEVHHGLKHTALPSVRSGSVTFGRLLAKHWCALRKPGT